MPSPVIPARLESLRLRYASDDSGALADYIPELAKADPSWFGMSLCTIDGHVYDCGDSGQEFTIQSVSKPFVYALALADNGPTEMLERVGVEPSGKAFNSILLDGSNRPHNPMVNAGAIATVAMVRGGDARFDRILDILGTFAGRPLSVDESVYQSERETGHQNRAIAHLMRTAGVFDLDVEEVLDVYFRQCSVLVTSRDLAVMAATLANGGRNPVTGRVALPPEAVGDVLSVMFTSGMYDYSGEWAFETGLPAKSGVSGGIAGLIPGQAGLGVFSPLVDERGNSVRGAQVCQDFSKDLGFHLFRNRTDSLPPIKSVSVGSARHSYRVRSIAETQLLKHHGNRITAIELQGPWTFIAVERLMRRVGGDGSGYVILDANGVGSVDEVARALMIEFAQSITESGGTLILAGTVPARLTDLSDLTFPTIDEALEWSEEQVLSKLAPEGRPGSTVTVAESDLGRGLGTAEAAALAQAGRMMRIGRGATVVREGAAAQSMYLVTSGHLTASIGDRRVASFGPGAIFGEMSFLTGARRTATVVADTACRLVEFTDISALPPEIREQVHRNIAVVIAERLAAANRTMARG
jgi:glutaminase